MLGRIKLIREAHKLDITMAYLLFDNKNKKACPKKRHLKNSQIIIFVNNR